MHALPAFFQRPAGAAEKIPHEWVEASDWFVIFTLGTLLFLLTSFALWAWIIWRRSTRPEPHVRLLMELEDHARREKQTANAAREEPETRAPWEQPADWWKQAED